MNALHSFENNRAEENRVLGSTQNPHPTLSRKAGEDKKRETVRKIPSHIVIGEREDEGDFIACGRA